MKFSLLLQLQASYPRQKLSEQELDCPSYAAQIQLIFQTVLCQEKSTTGRGPVQDRLNQ